MKRPRHQSPCRLRVRVVVRVEMMMMMSLKLCSHGMRVWGGRGRLGDTCCGESLLVHLLLGLNLMKKIVV